MKSQIRLAMRAPPMRQPTAAPAISPVLNCGPGVDVALDAELENVYVGEAGCGGACEVPEELGDVKLMEVVVSGGTWIAGIVVSNPTWKVAVPMVEVMVFVGVKGATVADRVIVEVRGGSRGASV